LKYRFVKNSPLNWFYSQIIQAKSEEWMVENLSLGKLPLDFLARLLEMGTIQDPRVVLGPGIGLDCAAVEFGSKVLVLKSDPITFATEEIGWYLVQVNSNDIATTGARPRWLLLTLLLPGGGTTRSLVEEIGEQVQRACRDIGISLIGGHTEITHSLDRPILVGTMIGEVDRERLVTPRGAQLGDSILLTKGVPIEATALLAREFPQRLAGTLTPEEIEIARGYLYRPGISVLKDAQIALKAGQVNAMHDPTEGGLASALWELAIACGKSLEFDREAVHIPDIARRVCQVFGIDPLGSIASGALLICVPQRDAKTVCEALRMEGISCAEIGKIIEGPSEVWEASVSEKKRLRLPDQDEIGRVFA
jgi:hydrogenase expression/formation protein HypE